MILIATVKLNPWETVELMIPGMLATLQIFFLTLILSVPIGVLIAWGRMSRFRVVSAIFSVYIAIMRGTPLMLQLMVVYYVPNLVFKMGLRNYELTAIVIAFSLNYAAYFAEIYRSGMTAIPVGQKEASYILGYGRFQSFRKIICPQVFKIVLPSMTNEIICLVKDTSIAYAIAYTEMFMIAKRLVASQTSLIPFVVSAVFYFVFNAVVAFFMHRLEKRMDYYK